MVGCWMVHDDTSLLCLPIALNKMEIGCSTIAQTLWIPFNWDNLGHYTVLKSSLTRRSLHAQATAISLAITYANANGRLMCWNEIQFEMFWEQFDEDWSSILNVRLLLISTNPNCSANRAWAMHNYSIWIASRRQWSRGHSTCTTVHSSAPKTYTHTKHNGSWSSNSMSAWATMKWVQIESCHWSSCHNGYRCAAAENVRADNGQTTHEIYILYIRIGRGRRSTRLKVPQVKRSTSKVSITHYLRIYIYIQMIPDSQIRIRTAHHICHEIPEISYTMHDV